MTASIYEEPIIRDIRLKTAKEWLSFVLWFDGRVGRRIWWTAHFVFVIFILLLASIDDAWKGSEVMDDVCAMLIILSLWPLMIINVKRWHDRNKSGLWCFIGMVPAIGPLWFLIECGFLGPNDGGENKY